MQEDVVDDRMPPSEPEATRALDFGDGEDDEFDGPAGGGLVSISRIKPRALDYERKMKRLYVKAASALDATAPDVSSPLGAVLCVITACAAKYYRPWPLVGEDGDEEVLLASRRMGPDDLRKHAALILETIGDEVHAATCAIEALVVFDLLCHDLPAGIGNLPDRDLCRALTERVWGLYGSIPGYTERHNRRERL